jgi:hypothetical protein
MTAFINRLYIYLNSIDINPENFEYDVNYERININYQNLTMIDVY